MELKGRDVKDCPPITAGREEVSRTKVIYRSIW